MTDRNETIRSNPTVESIFSQSQSKDLQKLLDFFENNLCLNENSDSENLNECYWNFFERLKNESVKDGNLYLNLPFDEQLKIYEEIDHSSFQEIWEYGKSFPVNSQVDTLKYLSLKYNSKYIEYLKELAKSDRMINKYKDSFLDSGGISPSIFASVIMEYDKYDIQDIRVRLVIAIHYLTLNDQNERREKY